MSLCSCGRTEFTTFCNTLFELFCERDYLSDNVSVVRKCECIGNMFQVTTRSNMRLREYGPLYNKGQ